MNSMLPRRTRPTTKITRAEDTMLKAQDNRPKLAIRIDASLRSRFKAHAGMRGITMESLLSDLIEDYLDDNET